MAGKENRTILVVDDEPQNILILNDVLTPEYSVLFATNGEKGIELAKSYQPALMLLDVVMPVMDGYEICRRLKADPTTAEIPIIFITAQMEEYSETKGLELGAIDYITKPVSASIVKARVKNHIDLVSYAKSLKVQSAQLETLYSQLDAEVEKAHRLHRRTMPDIPDRIENVSFSTYYQPAAKLGGDYFNIVRVGRKVVLYLSDVTGHGLDGAMLSLFVKNTINNYLSLTPETDISPSRILRFLAEQYHRDHYPYDYFVGIFLAVLDLDSHRLAYSGGGFQDTPLLHCRGGKQTRLAVMGLPISTSLPLELQEYPAQSTTLEPGMTLFINTDGLSEQQNNGVMFAERLHRVFFANSDLPSEVIVQIVREEFRHFNNMSHEGDDDITFVVVQTESPDEETLVQLELGNDFGELAKVRRHISSALAKHEDYHELMMVANELAANAIEHGNRFDPEKTAVIRVLESPQSLIIMVEDQGDGFDWRKAMQLGLSIHSGSERGRGMALSKLFSGFLYYNEAGNKAYAIKRKALRPNMGRTDKTD